jgi:LAO/AO transport system kinase
MNPPPTDIAEWARRIAACDRGALARAITLVESDRPADWETASELLGRLSETDRPTFRIGITGAPGAGKSTLIDALGLQWCHLGRRVAVLAIDPTSLLTGGSILGDKTRMEKLSRHPSAFVRSTPSGNTPGGVASGTAPAIQLLEAAGYDLIVVESVGAGQGESGISSVVDFLTVLVDPGGGDSLQAFKKGILELADLVVISKADQTGRDTASATFSEYHGILADADLRWHGQPPELRLGSAFDPLSVAELASSALEREAALRPLLPDRRAIQRKKQFRMALSQAAVSWAVDHPDSQTAIELFASAGEPTPHPALAALKLLQARILGVRSNRV